MVKFLQFHKNLLIGNFSSTVGDFRKHLQEKHEIVLPYQCNQCNLGFSRESFLKQHQDKHLSKQDWIWNCRICPQNFPSETRYLHTSCKNRQLRNISLFRNKRFMFYEIV